MRTTRFIPKNQNSLGSATDMATANSPLIWDDLGALAHKRVSTDFLSSYMQNKIWEIRSLNSAAGIPYHEDAKPSWPENLLPAVEAASD
jgi:hypothetical protein